MSRCVGVGVGSILKRVIGCLFALSKVTPETNKNFENFGTKKFKDSNMFRVSIDIVLSVVLLKSDRHKKRGQKEPNRLWHA